MSTQSENTKLAVIANDIQYIKADMGEIKRMQQTNYVSRDEFEPIKRLVYGVVAVVLLAVVGALTSLVVRG